MKCKALECILKIEFVKNVQYNAEALIWEMHLHT